MQFLLLLTKLALFVLVVAFAMMNTDPVVVRYYSGAEWQAPLVFVMLIAFGAGVAAGLFAALPRLYRQRREINALKRGSQSRAQPGTAVTSIAPTDTA